jgi:FkbM family methyltransferase
MMPKRGVFLDIGANIGIMTATTARKFPHLHVHAFEPVPSNIEAFNSIIKHFKLGNVTLHEVALGEENTIVKMVMPVQNNVRFQGLSHVVHDSITDHNEGEIYEVTAYKLDDFTPLKNLSEQIVGIKMDVENFERFVVKGGLKLIEQHLPVLYIELWDNVNREECFEALSALGYKSYTLEKDKLVLFDINKHSNHNFFFLPKGYSVSI